MMSRQPLTFLMLGVFNTLFVLVACGAEVGTSSSFRGPVGLETYSLRDQIRQSGAAAFDFVKELGIKEVTIHLENHYGMSREDLLETLHKHGLTPISALGDYNTVIKNPDKAIELARFLGVQHVGIATFPYKSPFDEAQVLKLAEEFNTVGKRFKEQGLQFIYHNHGHEFYPYKDGLTTFDLLMEKTDPENVKFMMDVLWVIWPGQDPVKLLEKYPNRWMSMHLKDLRQGVDPKRGDRRAKTNDVAIGTGQVNYPALLKAAQEAGVKHYFIEDESPDVLKQVPQSLKYLSTVEF